MPLRLIGGVILPILKPLNFNPPMAMAGNTTLAEAREIVDMIDPEEL